MKRRDFLTTVAAAAAATAAPALHAADWPERPIKLVVPYPPGGLTDIVSRLLADEVGRNLGTSFVIDNRAGAGGQIGLQAVLAAPRDGYTVALVVPATMITLPLTNSAYKIKPLEEFDLVTAAVDTYLMLIVDKNLGVKTLQEFIAYAKKNPGKLNYGTPGAGTSFHFHNVLMQQKLGIDSVHVPYAGESQVLAGVASGQLQYALVSNAGKAFVDGGQVVGLGVTSAQRVVSVPNMPTFREQGVDFTSDGWVGYAVAKGTPAPIVARLNAEFVKALNTPAVRKKFEDMGYQVVANSTEQFRTQIEDGTRRYGALVRSGAIKVD